MHQLNRYRVFREGIRRACASQDRELEALQESIPHVEIGHDDDPLDDAELRDLEDRFFGETFRVPHPALRGQRLRRHALRV
ncbi:MAG: hypothetical protein KC416_01995 [Myxococcales bacterium]|nr:hypothetical protein [Myxococcales bacterium]